MTRIEVHSISELTKVADALIAKITAVGAGPSVVLFSGPVGAGKTTLIQSLMSALGSGEVSSPTFALHQTYRWQQGARRAEHLDLYRIESDDDLETTGVWDILAGPSELVLIEWAEKLPDDFISPGRKIIRVYIKIVGENQRAVTILD